MIHGQQLIEYFGSCHVVQLVAIVVVLIDIEGSLAGRNIEEELEAMCHLKSVL
jgi:hypothetical protein